MCFLLYQSHVTILTFQLDLTMTRQLHLSHEQSFSNCLPRSDEKKPLSWRSLPRKHSKTLFNTLTNLHKTLEKSEWQL